MITPTVLALAGLFLAAAFLYAAVGHGGASGYLAVMALFGLAVGVMKPTALTLNILVSLIATIRFARAGHFSWRLLWPFAVTSVPAALLGGRWLLDPGAYQWLVGGVLIYAAIRMIRGVPRTDVRPTGAPHSGAAMAWGAGIGIVSGLTGVGGGIFLSPLLILLKWADPRQAAGVAAPFVLVNSIAGLVGHLSVGYAVPEGLPVWLVAVGVGGWAGAGFGSRRLRVPMLRLLLGVVLLIAGAKMLLA